MPYRTILAFINTIKYPPGNLGMIVINLMNKQLTDAVNYRKYRLIKK